MATRILTGLRNLRSRAFIHEFNYTLFTFATWIPALICFNDYVGNATWINGPSMYPFLNTSLNESSSKDVCWNSKLWPTYNLKRGMVVSFRWVWLISNWNKTLTVSIRSPNNPEFTAVKRVIALEGDLVYTRAPYPLPTVQIPANHVWVEGDNRDVNKTLDSNTYGPIPIGLIKGKVTRVLWPWKSFGPIKWQEFKGQTRVVKGRLEDVPRWDWAVPNFSCQNLSNTNSSSFCPDDSEGSLRLIKLATWSCGWFKPDLDHRDPSRGSFLSTPKTL